jgi:F-type H+-transporting ATPase subunit epsilon
MLLLKIITPEKRVYSNEVKSITCQTTMGEITVLPKHTPLLTLLNSGVITVVDKEDKEQYFSAGSGYIETDGKEARVLITRAIGQDEIDEGRVLEVKNKAEQLLKEQVGDAERKEAFAMLNRAMVDLKVIKKLKYKR